MQALGDKIDKLPLKNEVDDLLKGDEEGVCAAVRIRLSQTLTLTRVGFAASLELENVGNDPLTNIQVSLIVKGTELTIWQYCIISLASS